MNICRSAVLVVLALIAPTFLSAADCTPYVRTSNGNQWTYLVCMPENANPDLVVYAHGYVAPSTDQPVEIPADQLVIDGVSVPDLVTNLGYALAATSYPKTGLAIKEGVEDVKNLVDFYKTDLGNTPAHVYLAGVSEGGLVTVKAIEAYGGDVFSGGLALCGPVGSFQYQVNHFGDFRVIFDYFFPGVVPGNAVQVPPDVAEHWDSYQTAIATALVSKPGLTQQLFSVTKVPAPAGGEVEAAIGVLWYNAFATTDAQDELGGQPFDNSRKWYFGSSRDLRLNLRVDRFRADEVAVDEMKSFYDTTGQLPVPLVTMHTTGDPIVPYWHESILGLRVLATGNWRNFLHFPVLRYGHCNFTPAEVLFGFAALVWKTTGTVLAAEEALPTLELREQYRLMNNGSSARR